MQIYCSSCKKHTDNINAELYRTKNDRPYVISTCDICFKRKSQFIRDGDECFFENDDD